MSVVHGNPGRSSDRRTKECCLNVPAFDFVETVVGVGTFHGSNCDKFDTFGLKNTKTNMLGANIAV